MSLEADIGYHPIHESSDITVVKSSRDIVLDNYGIIDVDCGINIEIPAGYKISAKTLNCFAEQGVLAVSSRIEEKRLIITLVNLGKQIKIGSGDLFSKISIAPIYGFEWYSKKDYQ